MILSVCNDYCQFITSMYAAKIKPLLYISLIARQLNGVLLHSQGSRHQAFFDTTKDL